MILFRRVGVSLLLMAGLALMSFSFVSMAEGQGKDGAKKDAGVKPGGRVNWNETKVAFDMSGKPWSTAITWFSNQTQMPLTGKYPAPAGTVRFQNVVGKDGKPREYTLTEIYDILNEMLMADNHILLRRDATLMIFPADGEIPNSFIQRISVEELPEHARTEIVEVTLTLKGSLNAEEFAVKAKRLLGSFSSVTPIEDTNQLIVRADVGTIRRHLQTLTGKDLKGNPAVTKEDDESAHNLAHKCIYLRATAAEALLRKNLGNLIQVIEQKGTAVSTNPMEKTDTPVGPGGGFGKGGPPGGGGGPQTTRRTRITTITSDSATNTVFVSGPADKIEQAKGVLAKADVARGKGDKGILVGPPFFKTHEVPLGNADVMAKMLTDIFRDDSIRINVNPPSRLLVYADPQTHLEINLLLNSEPPAAQEMALVSLGRLDASRFADSLKSMFPDSKNGSPFIEADAEGNLIRLRGTAEQVKAVKLVIAAYDGGASGGGNVRMITLDKGSAATVGEALFQLFPRIRDNPVNINLPGGGFEDKKDAKDQKDEKKIGPLKSETVPLPRKSEITPERLTPDMVRRAMYDDTNSLKYSPVASYAQEPKLAELQPKKEPDKKKPQVTITAFGNRILLTSDDPEALDILQQMIRILVNTEAGPGDFEVLRLRYANAVEVAKILDEAFNGPKGGQGGRGGPGGGGGLNIPGIPSIMSGMLGIGGGGNNGRVENIRVVADPGTNVLLVRAKPIDLMTIRRLLVNSLDRDRFDFDNEARIKDFYITLKNVRAVDMAEILERSYHDSMNSRTSQAPVSAGPAFMFGGGGQQNAGGSGGAASLLSVTVDSKNGRNGVIVHCPTTLFKEIESLVKTIEKEAVDKKQIIKVVPVNDIDPYQLAAAVAAISGKGTTQQSGAFGSTMTPGSMSPGFGTPNRGGFAGNQGGGNPFGGGGNPFGGGGGNPFGGGGNPFGGGGGNPFGGGGNPGVIMSAPGGGGPGTGFTGGGKGGATPGGGGGGRPPGGGKGGGMQSRGPDFFEQRVMDDPSVNLLYDPAETPELPVIVRNENVPVIPVYTANPFYFASYLQPDEQLQPIIPEKVPLPKGAPDGGLAPPLLDFQIIQVPGGLVFLGSPQDYENVMRILEALTGNAAGSKVEIKLVPVRIGDPTHITGQVSKLLNQVQIEANISRIVTSGAGGGAPAAGGAAGGVPLPYGVVLLPQPRLSAIWVAAPAAKMKEIIGYIQTLDVFHADPSGAVIIPLKNAPASQVAAAVSQFFTGTAPTGGAATGGATGVTAFSPPDPPGYNQIRVTSDVRSNSVIVQASPADLVEIRRLIEHLDKVGSSAKTELRVIPLRNAVAFDMAEMLKAAVGTGTLTAQSTLGLAPGSVTTNAGGQTTTQGANQIANSKTSTVQFFTSNSRDGKPVESDLMEDIRFNTDVRTNSIIVSAPAKTMPLILALIRDLDVPPNARMEINIFTLKKSDAALMATTLQQLFLNTGGTIGGTTGGVTAGANAGGTGVGIGNTGGTARPLQITIQGASPDGPPIIDLRLTVDQRTNSLVVAGSRNDLLVVGSIIARIEDAKVAERCSQVVRLRNAQAVDIVNALTTYVTGVTTIYKTYGQGTFSLEPGREIVMVAEPITNSIILDAIPAEFDKMLRIIAHLDTTPPQVVVTVLIAEVSLTGNEEFGCEIGLQSPIAFARQVLPGAGTITYTTTAPTGAGTGPSGVSSTGTQVVAQNGLNFGLIGNPNNSLGYGTQTPGLLGYQGLSDLGLGRTSQTSGIGGFVFSAQSGMVNVLLRALKTQGRLTVLSRPNVQCLDKQAAVVVVGTNIPLNNGSNATATGVVSTAIIRQSVGVTLQVTPSITPDGRVMMRVIPEVTNVANTAFPIGPGATGTSLGIQHLETTVNAEDGETVLLGGLISRTSNKAENKVPWLGDLAGIGSLFRYRQEQTAQTELIIIMTPHIVRNRQEGERVLAEEARRINWEFKDVMRVHGSSNVAALNPAPMPDPVQPYRIIPDRQPNGMPGNLPRMPGCLPGQNCYPGGPAPMPNSYPMPNGYQTPNGYQGPQPQMMPPMSWNSPAPAPMPGPAVVNAEASAPTRIVPSVKTAGPSVPPANLNIDASTRLPGIPGPLPPPGNFGPPGGPPASGPIMMPQNPQVQAPPTSVPWLMPNQVNFYDKK